MFHYEVIQNEEKIFLSFNLQKLKTSWFEVI